MANFPRPITLIILDGFGYNPNPEHNAILSAKTPTWDHLWSNYPHTLISGSGHEVGLPDGQMGNSEVGHLNMGAGRVVFQDLPRIDHAIETGEFAQNPLLTNMLEELQKSGKALHLMGLLSPGGVHSHERHWHAMIRLAAAYQIKHLYLHAFLDGRDTPPRSAMASLQALQQLCKQLGVGMVASIVGRYYAMDRDNRWERTQSTYDMLTLGQAAFTADDAEAALTQAYVRNENDEFVQPTVIKGMQPVHDQDVVMFMNFRSDRARQLSRAFLNPNFQEFARPTVPKLAHFISLTHYANDIPSQVVFAPQILTNVLGNYLADLGLKQLRIAETEKYAHVTFFFNGGREQAYAGEERILIPSPKVATYDLQPEMSALPLTEQLTQAILSQQYDFIVCNFANPDMVGHTGNFDATVKAIETVDHCLNLIISALQKVGGEAIITADHGNAECMFDENTKQAHTAHTSEPIPLLYIGRKAAIVKKDGVLADIAPTILQLMDIKQPTEMTGASLLQLI